MNRLVTLLIMLAALAATLTGCGHPAAAIGNCTYTEARAASYSTVDATGVNIKGQVGTVRVVGRPGLQEVQVTGTACATSETTLKQVKLTAERSSDGWVRILTDVPRGNNKLDITVEVPDNLQVMVRNDIGTVEVSGINGGANVRGDNGTLAVSDVKGGVTVESRNGTVTVTRVEGDVRVNRADNGALAVTAVKGDVTVTKKTGVLTVVDVTGNLTVTGKVKGLVTHHNVSGRVSIPD